MRTIPSGTEVVADSVTGPLRTLRDRARWESPSTWGNQRQLGTIQYELLGIIPGAYRAAPTPRSRYRPSRSDVGGGSHLAGRSIPRRGKEQRSLPALARRTARPGHLLLQPGPIQAGGKAPGRTWWPIGPLLQSTYQKVVRMLLDVHLELGPPEEIVRNFEIVIERWPDEENHLRKGAQDRGRLRKNGRIRA